jgi:hypothetical protein
VREVDHPAAKLCRGLAGLLAARRAVLQIDLTGDRKGRGTKPFEQGPEKSPVDHHVVVEQDNRVVLRLVDADIVSGGKAQVLGQWNHPDLGKFFSEVADRAVGAPVVDNQDLMIPTILLHSFQNRGDALRQKLFAVPVEYDDRGEAGERTPVVRDPLAGEASQAVDQIKVKQHHRQQRE